MSSEIITISTPYVEVRKENFPYLNGLFKQESDQAWEMIGKSNIPQKAQNVNILALIQLLYLGKNSNNCPFTEKQLKVIKNSQFWGTTTTWSLKTCVVINLALCIAMGFSPLFPTLTRDSAESSNSTDFQSNATGSSLSPVQQGVLSTTLVVIAVTTILSFWATGFSPNLLSNSSNETQDVLGGIKDRFENLAGRLVQLYFSPGQEEAVHIANNIALRNLFDDCFSFTKNKEKTKQIIAPITEAVLFILSEERYLPGNTSLLNTIVIHQKNR